jgi:hypothetical protein
MSSCPLTGVVNQADNNDNHVFRTHRIMAAQCEVPNATFTRINRGYLLDYESRNHPLSNIVY